MKFFFAIAAVVSVAFLFACKEENEAAAPLPPPLPASAALESLMPPMEPGDSLLAEEAKPEEPSKKNSAYVPPTSAVSAPIAALAAKTAPKGAPKPPPPEPLPPPEPKIAHDPSFWAEPAKPAENSAKKPESEAKPIAKPEPIAKAEPALPQPEDAGQLSSGRYTIQIGVFPNEASANKLISRLAENGISAYHARVYNPAKLLGSHYRVRVGYFSGRANAETYAKAKLEPIGQTWWVDLSKNDGIGSQAAEN